MESSDKNRRKVPWRKILGIISICYIILMWTKTDIFSVYTTISQEEIIPLIVMTVIVSLIKVAVITGGILLVKWLIKKVTKQ